IDKAKARGLSDSLGVISDVAMGEKGLAVGCWGSLYRNPLLDPEKSPGPRLVHFGRGAELFVADTSGIVRHGEGRWQTDLNKEVPKSPKPWVANARATPIVPGVWQIPGGRVESDLGGQCLIEAPDGYVLIEGHAGLSFEREWAAMTAV